MGVANGHSGPVFIQNDSKQKASQDERPVIYPNEEAPCSCNVTSYRFHHPHKHFPACPECQPWADAKQQGTS